MNTSRKDCQRSIKSCLTGINRILRLTLDIAEKPTTTDDKTKLQALALANECYKAKLDLTTNSVVVTDTISMLKNKLDHLNTSERELTQDIQENKLKNDGEESQQQQQTPSGIFSSHSSLYFHYILPT